MKIFNDRKNKEILTLNDELYKLYDSQLQNYKKIIPKKEEINQILQSEITIRKNADQNRFAIDDF